MEDKKEEITLKVFGFRVDRLEEKMDVLTVNLNGLTEIVKFGFGETERRFGEVDQQLVAIRAHFEQVDKRFDEMDRRFDLLAAATHEEFLAIRAQMATKVELRAMEDRLMHGIGALIESVFFNLDRRLRALEAG